MSWCLGGEPPGIEYHGQVTFGGLPAPGATITATGGSQKFVTTSDQQGLFSFPDLSDGTWTIEVEMTGFSTIKQDVVIAPNMPAAKLELKVLPLAEIRARVVGPGIAPASGAANVGPATKTSPSRRQEGVASPAPTIKRSQAQNEVSPLTIAPGESGPGPQPAQTDNQQSGPESAPASEAAASPETLNQLATPGLLINGSVINGGASPFAQLMAFGNNRKGGSGLYNGGIGLIFDTSALDARPFSLSGQNTPKAAYHRVTGVATLSGPLKIPHILQRGPNFFVGYQWTRYVDATTQSALVPDSAERGGDFSQVLNALGRPVQIFDPATGLPFSGNIIPQSRISSQASALLNFYPLPSFRGDPRYNYQIPITDNTHQDALQSRFNQTFNPRNELYGGFDFRSTRSSSPNLFGFLDSTGVTGVGASANWSHRFNPRLFLNLGYRFSRIATRITPYWENRENVSGAAGIVGNNQDPANWGPPTLIFSSGLAGLSDGQSSFDRNQTDAWSYSMLWSRERHNLTFGGDFRRQQFNYLSQQNPRGDFTFTGAATQGGGPGAAAGGSDFTDFLLGIPDTSSIAFGNADKYFRESVYDAYVTDDWRMSPQFTLNAGMRWEYGAPVTELYGRLVNLDITPGFAAVAPVVSGDPVGPLTGQGYPRSLIHPDPRGLEPRIGIAWRPMGGSSLLVRAGYGIYKDTSVYPTIALQMAQQAPLSKSLSVQNSSACRLTLANGFNACPSTTPDTFAVDPNYRLGYAQNWDLSVQRDLPWSLQLIATYLGIKGTRGAQEFLPNTFPAGAANPCPTCPAGFVFLTSNGNSTRQAGQIQLRRRLHNGLTATVRYTFSKSIDDDSVLGGQGAILATQYTTGNGSGNGPGGPGVTFQSSGPAAPSIAQNWLDLRAERGLSTFDQRHLLNLQMQYTTGMGLGGKTLLSGWRGTFFKEWTFLTQITVGSGLPETPIYPVPVQGTGVTGSIRPDYTGAPLYAPATGLHLNPAAYSPPPPGQWGNAGRDSITGPPQFSLNSSMGRTFRLHGRFNLDLRVDSTNFLNHPTFASWNTTVTSAQFGLPTSANAMRSLQSSLRLRF
ncbi:MAG TPA: TonB-dependent receptor [Terriglobia bacterium]|nr:TonB-dependent receptor [Terriglobia bacterium]